MSRFDQHLKEIKERLKPIYAVVKQIEEEDKYKECASIFVAVEDIKADMEILDAALRYQIDDIIKEPENENDNNTDNGLPVG